MTLKSFLTKTLAIAALSTASASAATVTSSPSAPAINDADVANYGAISGTDKWFGTVGGDNDGRGQTFVTGPGAVRLKAITYQTSTSSVPTKVFKIRVGKISGTTFTPVYTETATQSANWGVNHYVTWTFTNPPLLDGGTVYGVDVIMVSSTTSWQTGIPYVNVTDNEFAGGARYLSVTGAGSVTGAAVSLSTGDRIFHLDLETPLGGAFSFVAGNPTDNSTGNLIRDELVGTFSRNLIVGTGNITIRNLTDATDTVLAVSNPAFSISGNLLKIKTAGLINLNKSYAIQIDSSALKDATEAFFPGIADDTTWNFATAVSDPFLDAVAALKNHINGSAVLDSTQIAAIFDTIVVNKVRFSESAQTITAVFGLVAAYDTAKGTSFLLNTGINFGNRTTQTKTSDWAVYQVMQTIVDEIYTPATLAAHEALLTGFKLGVSAHFPGSCPAPSGAADHRSVLINASFTDTFGRDTQSWTSPARKPTGTYLPPGYVATVTVPAALVNTGYKIRVGCHSWDLESRRTQVKRLDRATVLYPITSATTKIASPYGGGIYIEVPFRANAGQQSVTVTGAKRSAYFSKKTFHTTTPTEWLTERTYTAPWADFQTDKYMTQVPRKWIYNYPDPTAAMNDWDAAMDAINNLMGFPLIRGKETMYCQADIILRSSVHAPGYPAVNNLTNPNSEVSPTGYAGNYLIRGPRENPVSAHIEFHEQGHAYGFPKFGGESESNVNLLQPAMLNRAFGYDFDVSHRSSLGSNNTSRTMNNTAVAWMCVFNFSPREVPMDDSEKAYQHKGHAKWMDIARLFGWTGMDNYWKSFMQDDANGVSYGGGTDDFLLRLSRHVGKDIRPLFHFWGIHPQNPTTLAAAFAAANPPIPASLQIRDLLLTYKGLVPANNAAFRTFALAWWGKQPNFTTGAWEEREHARQWDTTALYGAGDQQRSEATNPGEIYNENSANDIRNRVQELIDLYFPSAITPGSMTFAIAPTVINSTTVGMTAINASAAVGPIEYLFDETSGNAGANDSAWQTSPTYQDSGLTPGQTYTYTVTARDGLGNLNTVSAAISVTPTAAGDILPPIPSPMTFATPPNTLDEETITMTASAAGDFNGVEYYFENITNNTNSGWQDSPVYTETTLQAATAYTYRVRARDKSPNQNATAFSANATANTADLPDVTPPQIVSVSPADGSVVSNTATNLVVTFDEPIILGTGTVALRNLTDSTTVEIDVPGAEVSVSGSTLTINPTSNLSSGKTYAIQISTGTVLDITSNPFIGITDDGTWNFTTPIVINSGGVVVPAGKINGSPTFPIVGTLYALDTPFQSTIPLLGPVGADWPSAADDGWRMLSGSGLEADHGESPWEPDGTAIAQARTYRLYNAPGSSYTFNLPDGAIINGIYATWLTRNTSGAAWSYTEGSATSSNTISMASAPTANLRLNWSDFNGTVRTGNFQRVLSSAVTVVGGNGFTLNAVRNGNTHQADAVILDVTLPTGEIAVEQPAAMDIASAGTKDFGSVNLGANTELEFTIRNSGLAALNLTGSPLVNITGTELADFTVTAAPTSPIFSNGGTTTFTVRFAPSAAGIRAATLSIANNDTNDTNESPFTINLSGTGIGGDPYQSWSSGAAFDIDTNNDGVDNGLAFLLGASGPNANATGLLPSVSHIGGNLVLTFNIRNDRGTATAFVQHSSDFGLSDPWESALIPNEDSTVNDVVFDITPGTTLNAVQATIPTSKAGAGKIFGRFSGVKN